jgi:hypothetical protein
MSLELPSGQKNKKKFIYAGKKGDRREIKGR